MLLSIADWERAEHLLEPLHQVTEQGVALAFCQASDPDQPALRVAYRTYQPPEGAAAGARLAILFLHDVHQSGVVYDEAACALAERGLFAVALSLSRHGSGRWYSDDSWPQEDLTVERYCRAVRLVIQALPGGSRCLVLVGGGVLGSLLAQQVAQELPLAGIALLGGCLPHLAAATWTADLSRRWWPRKRDPASTALVPPPDQTMLRARWLGYAGVSDADVFSLWRSLCAESPTVRQTYEALVNRPARPPALPALVLAGEHDTLLRRELLDLTATVYRTDPVIVPGAPHLLVRSAQRHLVFAHLAAFCQACATKGAMR